MSQSAYTSPVVWIELWPEELLHGLEVARGVEDALPRRVARLVHLLAARGAFRDDPSVLKAVVPPAMGGTRAAPSGSRTGS
jgi:hypothetical protein